MAAEGVTNRVCAGPGGKLIEHRTLNRKADENSDCYVKTADGTIWELQKVKVGEKVEYYYFPVGEAGQEVSPAKAREYTAVPETLDGKNDGELSDSEAWSCRVEGVVEPIKEAFNTPAKAAVSTATIVAGAAVLNCIPLWGQIAFGAVCLGAGIYGLFKSNSELNEAKKQKSDKKARQAYKRQGAALFEVITSIIPMAKAFKSMKTVRAARKASLVTQVDSKILTKAGVGPERTFGRGEYWAKTKNWFGKKFGTGSSDAQAVDKVLVEAVNAKSPVKVNANGVWKGIRSQRKTGLTEAQVRSLGTARRTGDVKIENLTLEQGKELLGEKVKFMTTKGTWSKPTQVTNARLAKKGKNTLLGKTIEYEGPLQGAERAVAEWQFQASEFNKFMSNGKISYAIEHYKKMEYMVNHNLLQGEKLEAAKEFLAISYSSIEPFMKTTSWGLKSGCAKSNLIQAVNIGHTFTPLSDEQQKLQAITSAF